MKKVNTHGLKMIGLRKAASETKGLKGYYSGLYYQLNYDLDTGKIITELFCSSGQHSYCVYDDPNIITVGKIDTPKTMQQLANMIQAAVADHEERQKWLDDMENNNWQKETL